MESRSACADADVIGFLDYDDEPGNGVREIRPGYGDIVRTYDAQNRLLSETNETYTNALAQTSTSTHDFRGNLLSEPDPEGFTTTYVHDSAGNVTRECNPVQECRRSVYDNRGFLLGEVDARGTTSVYTYDTLGRMTSMTSTRAAPGGGLETLLTISVLDEAGRVTDTIHPDQTRSEVTKPRRIPVSSWLATLLRAHVGRRAFVRKARVRASATWVGCSG